MRHLDGIAWTALLMLAGTDQTQEDWAETLKEVMPDLETEEEEAPLTREERNQLADLASEAAR